MPGIRISTAVRTGPTSNTVRESSQAFFVGKALRGPVNRAVLVTSIEDYENVFGGYISGAYLHSTVQTFFEEGGTQCYIARATASSGDVAATATLADTTTPLALNALTFTAVGPGTWANGATGGLSIDVAAGSTVGTVNVSLLLNDVVIFATGDKATNEAIVGAFASSAIASRYVTATVANPAALIVATTVSATNLASGANGSIAAADYVTALALFLDSYGTGVVACPESETSDVYDGLDAHANTYNRIAILHPAVGTANPTTFAGTVLAAVDHGEHLAMYWPWIYVPTSVAGVNRLIPPDGYVAAVRARAHNQVGPQAPAAGIISNARYVVGLESDTGKAVADTYDAAQVNVIRIISGTIRVYGARSLTDDLANFRYITAQDIVNGIVVDAYRSLEDVVFSVIDGRNSVFASIEAKLIAVLEPLRTSGALYEAFDSLGRRIDYGYTVKCDSSLNPVTQLADGLVRAKVGVRVSSVGDKIDVDIVKSNLTNSVV